MYGCRYTAEEKNCFTSFSSCPPVSTPTLCTMTCHCSCLSYHATSKIKIHPAKAIFLFPCAMHPWRTVCGYSVLHISFVTLNQDILGNSCPRMVFLNTHILSYESAQCKGLGILSWQGIFISA